MARTAGDAPDACRNCGTPLYGEYCFMCGQSRRGLLRHLPQVLADLADLLLNVDGRLLRTVPALLLYPGRLTRAYFDGHRARYLSPVRLFAVLCLATFFAAKLATPAFVVDPGSAAVALDGNTSWFVIDPGQSAATLEDDAQWGKMRAALGSDLLPEAVNRWLRAQADHVPDNWKRVQRDPDLLRSAFYSALPTALFVLVPVFALVLMLLHAFSGRLYMEHLIVALHGHAFVCAMLLALMGIDMLGRAAGPGVTASLLVWAQWACFAWIPVYLWLLLARAYRARPLVTLLRFGVLASAELMLLAAVIAAAMMAALVWL